MHHSSNRDPLDGPVKWERRKPVQPEASVIDPWAHIPDIKRPAKNSSQPPVSPAPKHQSCTPIASVVKEKVAEIALPQSSVSIPSKTSKFDRSAITTAEHFIANQLLKIVDIDEVSLACSDPSEAKFQSLIAPQIKRLCEFTQGETINPDHVLHLLRTTLKITIPQ